VIAEKQTMKSSKLKELYGLLTTFNGPPPWQAGQTTLQLIFPLLFLLLFSAAFAYAMPQLSTIQTLAFAGGIILVCVCMISTEAALYILIFSMLLGPEIIVGKTGGNSLGRGVTLRLDDIVILLIGVSWLAKMAINKKLGLFVKTPLNKPIAFYLFACLISTLLGAIFLEVELKTGFLFVLKYFEYVFVYFMVVNHLKTERQAKNYLWALLFTCVIVSLIGISQVPGGERVSAPFEGENGEPNTFGGYLLFMICISMGLFISTLRYPNKLLYGVLVVLFAIPFFYTQSRSSYFGVIPAIISFIWLADRRRWSLVVVGLIAVGLLLPILTPEPAKERIAYTFEQGKERNDVVEIMGTKLDTSTTTRLRTMQHVAEDWVEHPIFGFGITGYRIFVDTQYFKVIIETGLFGLFMFLLLKFRIFAEVNTAVRKARDPFEKGVSTGFMAGFIGLLCHAIGANTFILVRIMEPFWFLLAIVIMLPEIPKEKY
jgi:hypothetical protein